MENLNQNQLGSVGKRGEDIACSFLSAAGYKLIARNIKYGRHEIDIVCIDGDMLVFIEVKTRSVLKYSGNSRFGPPSAAVTYKKQRNLIDAARQYIKECKCYLSCRFDVIEVVLNDNTPGAEPLINHIKRAFTA